MTVIVDPGMACPRRMVDPPVLGCGRAEWVATGCLRWRICDGQKRNDRMWSTGEDRCRRPSRRGESGSLSLACSLLLREESAFP
eukprot:7173770-Prymnesium_polylepis.1